MEVQTKRPGSALGRSLVRKRSRSSSSSSASTLSLSRLQELHRAIRQETKSRHREQLRSLRERSTAAIVHVEQKRECLSERRHAEKLALDAGLSRHECVTDCRSCNTLHSEPQGAVWSRRCGDKAPLHICHVDCSNVLTVSRNGTTIECKKLAAKAKLHKKAAHVELEAQENMAMNEFTVRSNALKSRQEAELRALTKSQQSELNLACIGSGQLLTVCGECSTHFQYESLSSEEHQETDSQVCTDCQQPFRSVSVCASLIVKCRQRGAIRGDEGISCPPTTRSMDLLPYTSFNSPTWLERQHPYIPSTELLFATFDLAVSTELHHLLRQRNIYFWEQ